VTDQLQLKLIVLYDRNRNEYSIAAHNLNAEQAQALVDKWNPHMIQGCSLIVLDQPRRHRVAEGKDCRTCREIVARTAGLEPKPKYTRRTE